jgi:glycerol-3-phosphate dehydrogenase
MALRKLGRPAVPCTTTTTPLAGADIRGATAQARARLGHLPPDVVANLLASYGVEAEAVLGAAAGSVSGADRLCTGRESLESEAIFAVEREMAVQLADVVFRRTGLGTIGHPGLPCLQRCADIIGVRLGWGADERARQIRDTERQLPIAAGS